MSGEPPPPFPDPIPTVIDFGTVIILAGAPGVGKTTMLAEWLARWRDGRTICGHATNRPTAVYYLSTDRGGHSTLTLLDQHALREYVVYYNTLDDPELIRDNMLNYSQALNVLRWCLGRFPQPIRPGSLLVLDPAAPLFVPGDQNSPRAIARLMWELHVIAREFQITIIVLAHFGKQLADANQRYRRPQDRISGSGAWSGFSDTQIYMVDPEPPAQPYHVLGWNPRHAAPQEFKFVRQGPVFVPYRSLEDIATKTQIPQSAYRVFALIPDEGCSTQALQDAAATELGISRATFFRALDDLLALGVIEWPRGFVKRIPLEQVEPVPDPPAKGAKGSDKP